MQRIFPATKTLGPVTLCKSLHRLEAKAHRLAEDYCNGYYKGRVINDETDEAQERDEAKILKSVLNILGPMTDTLKENIFLNSDPRGYSLKIKSEAVKAMNLEIHRDMGGYGILCPEF